MMTGSELSTLEEKGFVVLFGAVPSELREGALEAIHRRIAVLRRTDARLMDQATQSGFFPMWNAAALWQIRATASVRTPFERIYGTGNLWVSLDRCGYRAPRSEHLGCLSLHWDDDPSRWDYADFQGVVALSSVGRFEGCFVCAPSLYRTYREAGSAAANTRLQRGTWDTIEVELHAGDLLVFDYRLAHGTTVHRGDRARVVQYLAFVPTGHAEERLRRVRCWETGMWRGNPMSPAYLLADEAAPTLSNAGWLALYGRGW